MPDPFRKKPSVSGRFNALHGGSPNPPASGPISGRAKALHSGLTELQQANRATQQAQLAQFAQAGAALAAANEARYRAQLRTSHLVAPQDATSRYAAHLRQPVNPQQQALVSQARARQLYMASRATVRPDTRSEAQRRTDRAAGELRRQGEELAVLSPATVMTVRHDQVFRGVAVGGAVVVTSVAAAKVTAAAVMEEAAAYTALRWIGWRAAGARFIANTVGQGVGQYVVTGDAELAVKRINWVSPFLSAAGLPLVTTSVGSAAFKVDKEQGYRSVLNGKVSGTDFATDFILNYGFGQATRQSGFDDWYKSPEATSLLNEARYRASLQLSPRLAQGVGTALPEVLETGNRAASSAVRKVGQEVTKKHLPK